MPATGLHGILHYLIVKVSKKINYTKRKISNDFYYGFIIGAFLPDYDPFISLLIWLTSGELSIEKLAEIHEAFHRTATHSIFFAATLMIIGYILGSRYPKAKSIILGIGTGIILHAIIDLPYMLGVAILWPLSTQKFGLFWNLPPLINHIRQALFKIWYIIFFNLIYYVSKTKESRRIKISTLIFTIFFATTIITVTKPTIFDIVHGITELISLVLVAYLLYAEKPLIYEAIK